MGSVDPAERGGRIAMRELLAGVDAMPDAVWLMFVFTLACAARVFS
jgi:hypothetical protein